MNPRWVFWLVLAALPAAAQSPAEIRGTIVDGRGGEALGNVQVQLASTEFRSVSDDKGQFRIENLPPGDYVLSVSTVGMTWSNARFTSMRGRPKSSRSS